MSTVLVEVSARAGKVAGEAGLNLSRRSIPALIAAALVTGAGAAAGPPSLGVFGQVNRLAARPGCADQLREELMSLPGPVTGCTLYSSAVDTLDANVFWTVELWDSEAAHAAALRTDFLRASVARCLKIVQKFNNIATFRL